MFLGSYFAPWFFASSFWSHEGESVFVGALQPSVRALLVHDLQPSGSGTVTRRWATRPFADANAWTEGRVEQIGSITRNISTPDGDYDIATADVKLSDADGFFRGLMASPSTWHITAREMAIQLLSEYGRSQGLAWRDLLRGRVTDIQAGIGRVANIRLADVVGSHFSGFDLDQTLGVTIPAGMFPFLPGSSAERIFPIVIGEHSDRGAVDANGESAEKGMLPVVDVGYAVIGDDGSFLDDATIPTLPAPSGLSAEVQGTPGSTSREYTVTALSAYGETIASTPVTVTNAPNVLNGTDFVRLTWDAVDGAVAYRVYRGNRLLDTLDNDGSFTDPETTFDDDGSPSASGHAAPSTNGALIDQVVNGVSYSVWRTFILKIGAASEVHDVYGSNLEPNGTPKRIRLPESVYGDQVLVYGRPGYPHADPYVEQDGIRYAPMYARGPLVDHHLRGIVTFAWNGCGDDEVGDGTGPTITEAFYAWQHVVNVYRLMNNGEGYRTGDFPALETYSNGVAKLRSSAVEACQDLTVEWIGGRGYQASIAISTPTTLREFLRRFAVTFACYYGVNHHGQVYPILIDDAADPAEGRHYRDRIEITRAVAQEFDHDAVETRVVFHFDWNQDQQEFAHVDNVLEDALASDANGGVRQRNVRQCYYTRDAATAFDSNGRHLTRYKVAPRRFAVETDLTGLEDELGAQVRITHYDGAGGENGDEATPFLVVGHSVNPEGGTVVLTGFDLKRITQAAFPLLEDEDEMDEGNLYSEDVFAAPPDGAYELR